MIIDQLRFPQSVQTHVGNPLHESGPETISVRLECDEAIRCPYEDVARCMANELNRTIPPPKTPWLALPCKECRGFHVEREGRFLAR